MENEKSIKNFSKNYKMWLAITTLLPIFLFAVADQSYWEVMEKDFGLNNSWYGIAIDFQTTHSGGSYSYLFPNVAFILFAIAVIGLNGTYYSILKRKNRLN
jgi:hypothetical protein